MSAIGEKIKAGLDILKARLNTLSEALRGAYIKALGVIDDAKALIDKIKGMFIMAGLVALLCAGDARAGLFGGNKALIENDMQLLKMQMENGVKVDKVMDTLADIRVNVNTNISLQNEIKASLQAQAQAIAQASARIAGVDNSRNTATTATAGRDVKQSNRNDSGMIKSIFTQYGATIGALFTFLGSFFIGVWGLIKFLQASSDKIIMAKDEQIKFLIDAFMRAEAKNDEYTQRTIEALLNKNFINGGKV